ncbi:MAG: hypothetical protein E3J41_00045 [Candidatus Cloacimonadota bacterium]|jgi:hypothetical protein|nr:MAG: hypothetical protein E3J41_00045 [Candidatus Cloacimonadota bacterium]
MMKNITLSTILLLYSLLISVHLPFLHSSENPKSLQGDLNKYLPGTNEIGEWKEDGSPCKYKGEDLYSYINGGAEIYHEYGFKQVIVQDYTRKNGKSIALEIFEMESTEGAYGIYTFKTSTEGKELALGDKAQLADYYLNFWKGDFVVTLIGFDEDEETVKGLQKIARAVDTKIKSRGREPAFVSLLPEKDLIEQSIRYFKGNLGLYNSYPFFTQDIFRLKKGIKGDYKAGYSVFIISYKESEENQKIFNDVKKSFEESPRYKDFRSINERFFQVEDGKGKLAFVSHFKKHFLIAIGTMSQTHATKILSVAQGNISNK